VRVLSVGNRCLPWSIGGYEVMWKDAVEHLRAAGHELRMLTTRPDPSDLAGESPPEVYRELRWYWHEHAFPQLGLRDCIELERFNAATFDRHVREFRPEAVLWWAMGGMSLSLLARAQRDRLPSLGMVADDWMLYGPRVDGWLRRWRAAPMAPIGAAIGRITGLPTRVEIGGAARWLFISQYTLDAAREAGLALGDAAIAPAGVDLKLFTESPPAPWGWRLLYSGRIEQRKGVDTAVEAMASLPPEATLTLHGPVSVPYREELLEAASRAGAADRVLFSHSEHEQLPRVYAQADAVLFPVRWREPWGIVPLEAMAIGRPVLASRAGGGAAEYLADGRNCLQFDPGDATGLAAAVKRLADDGSVRATVVAGGRATAGRYTTRGFVERIEHELVTLSGR
jgi:glycogen(starch) synthase